MDTARIGRGRSRPKDEVPQLERALERFQRTLSGASEPARTTFVEHYREQILALVNAPEPPNSKPPNPEPPNPEAPNPEAPAPEAPRPAEIESSTVPPAGKRAYGVRNPSRLTRGSAPNKSTKNAPGRHRFSSDNQPPKSKLGRPKGSPNTLSLSLRQIIRQAGENVGNVSIDKDGNRINGEGGMLGYMEWLARNEPRTYGVLLRADMPAEIRATMTLKPVLTREEALAEMRARGLPTEWIENMDKIDEELGPDDEPNPYDQNVIDLKPNPPTAGAD
jgi:hypothetical protein